MAKAEEKREIKCGRCGAVQPKGCEVSLVHEIMTVRSGFGGATGAGVSSFGAQSAVMESKVKVTKCVNCGNDIRIL